MSTNPHAVLAERYSEDGHTEDAAVEATLALAWETARLADEQRTANLIAVEQGQYQAFRDGGGLTDEGHAIWEKAGTQVLKNLELKP